MKKISYYSFGLIIFSTVVLLLAGCGGEGQETGGQKEAGSANAGAKTIAINLANLIRFNFFTEKGAIEYDEEAETYRLNFDKIKKATDALSQKILTFQGNGDYKGVDRFVKKYGEVGSRLQDALDHLTEQNIARDIIFDQGKEVLGL